MSRIGIGRVCSTAEKMRPRPRRHRLMRASHVPNVGATGRAVGGGWRAPFGDPPSRSGGAHGTPREAGPLSRRPEAPGDANPAARLHTECAAPAAVMDKSTRTRSTQRLRRKTITMRACAARARGARKVVARWSTQPLRRIVGGQQRSSPEPRSSTLDRCSTIGSLDNASNS